MDVTKKSYNEIANDYLKNFNKMNVTRYFRKDFVKYVKTGKILDLGCGPGQDAAYFSKYFDVVGVDFSIEMIRIAKRISPQSKFLHRDMRKITFKQNTFDGIWASQSIHHISKKDFIKLLIKMKRILKNDSIIFISFREGSFEGFTDKSKTSLFQDKKRLLSMYKLDDIKKLLKALNYKIIKLDKVKRKHGGEIFINVFAINIK